MPFGWVQKTNAQDLNPVVCPRITPDTMKTSNEDKGRVREFILARIKKRSRTHINMNHMQFNTG